MKKVFFTGFFFIPFIWGHALENEFFTLPTERLCGGTVLERPLESGEIEGRLEDIFGHRVETLFMNHAGGTSFMQGCSQELCLTLISFFEQTSGANPSSHVISIYKDDPHGRKKEVARLSLNSQCHFDGGSSWIYDREGRLERRTWVSAEREIVRVAHDNREIMALEDIYCKDCGYFRPLHELERISQRRDRIPIAVVDRGMDFNHQGLAYKVLRPDPLIIEGLKRKREKLTPGGDDARIDEIDRDIEIYSSIGWDYRDNDNNPYDYSVVNRVEIGDPLGLHDSTGHGTAVISVATSGSDDIAVLPIRRPENVNAEQYAEMMEFMRKRGVRIVGMSYHFYQGDFICDMMVHYSDILFVVTSGNKGVNLDEHPLYPAVCDAPNMIVVTSVDGNNALYGNFSTTHVDIGAVGENVVVFLPGNSSGVASGSSYAMPQVERVAAGIAFENRELGPLEMIAIIRESMTPVPSLEKKTKFGGVLNEERALQLARH